MQRIYDLVANRPVYSLSPEMTVAEAVAYLVERNVGAAAVVQDGHLVGLFSERDLLKRVVAAGRDPRQVRVVEVMTTQLHTADAQESSRACLERMREAGVRHLPVLSEGKLLGLVTMRDLMLADVEEKDGEIKLMRAYISIE